MKTNMNGGVARWCLAAGIVLLLSSPQSLAFESSLALEFDVPFEFVIGTKTLPPGGYVLDLASAEDADALVIRSLDGATRLLFVTRELPQRGKVAGHELVFEKLEGKYHLREVWGLEYSGRQLTPSNDLLTAKAGPKGKRELTRIAGRRAGGQRETGK